MNVGIDCQAFGAGARTGFSTYLRNLLRALRTVSPEDRFLQWTCCQGWSWRIPHQLWWDQVRLPWAAHRDQVDLVHVPAFSCPQYAPVPVVFTVHDVMYTRHPEWLSGGRARWYWGRWIPWSARRADAIIVPSEATKEDLVDSSGVPPDRITVIPLAVDPHFMIPAAPERVAAMRQRRELRDPYILYVGSIDRRKDWDGLLRAFALVRARLKPMRLVIVGHVIPGRTQLHDAVRTLGLADEVLLPGHVPDEELLTLYAGADLFVFPSRYEGFGLPPLEAMAQGAPVVTYRCSSLPEVVGDAAVLIEAPFHHADLAEAIYRGVTDSALRRDLVERGFRRAAAFSWEDTARRTREVYARCSGSAAG